VGALRIAVFLIAFAVLGAPAAEAAFPGANGRIAFNSNRDGDAEIYTMAPDTSDLRRLTAAPGEDFGPAWSADGSRIAFTSERDGNQEIYVMDADGSNETRLTESPGADLQPAWAPDGRRVVFTSDRAGSYDLYIVNVDGSDLTRLTSAPGRELDPEWSPDGRRVAYASHDGPDGVLTVTPTGGDVRQLTTTGNVIGLDWSPDGSRIVFTTGDVLTMNAADGSNEQTIVTDTEPNLIHQLDPAWAPAGDLIAYHAFACSFRGCFSPAFLQVVHPDGTGRATLLSDGGDNAQPDWQPLVGPSRADYRNSSKFCKALRDFLGDAQFGARYGSHGACVNAAH
jgi:Tol biopolymer transport system component